MNIAFSDSRGFTWHHVGGQHGCFAVPRIQEIQKRCQAGVAIVKFVVAQSKSVKTDLIHHGGVGFAIEQAVIERASNGIARVDFDWVAKRSLQKFKAAYQHGEATISYGHFFDSAAIGARGIQVQPSDIVAKIIRFQMGMVIVHVQDVNG